MTDVKVGIPPVYALISTAARRVEVVSERIGRGDVNRVGKGIRCQCLQSSRQTPLEFDLEGVVVRCRRIVSQTDLPKVRVGIEYVGYAKKVAPDRSDVG